MDLDSSILQLVKEEQHTLEQPHAKRPRNRSSSSEEEEKKEEVVVVIEEEEEEDCDSKVEVITIPPRPVMTDEEHREYCKHAKASKGFDVPKFEGQLCGMIEPCYLNEITTPLLTDISKQALQVYNNNNNTRFEFVKVVKATNRLVAGRIYYITFEALSGNVRATFRARVWNKIMNKGLEVKSCEIHSEEIKEACPGKICCMLSDSI
ncbi:hypothetical protein PIB30_072696 [Stylosanthes scabra]|uniref:Cystatin domain-containing protein n=1 Tax=Stylosanthes scabra TaxID=79078 RepID=A0ABU6RPM6_9FABA|nr:hypothetical protein [Stylosanthes scabra]